MPSRLYTPVILMLHIVLVLVLFFIPEAHAQLDKINTLMANISAALSGISVAVFTVCIIWAGYKMAFQGATWSDVAYIVIGGLIVGAAGQIAGMILGK